MSPSLTIWRRIALALGAPLMCLGLLEGGLALTGWVEPLRLLQRSEYGGERFWTTHPTYGRTVFRPHGAPMPSQIWVPVDKPEGVKRVVLVGESAAQGFPDPDFSLARLLEAAWTEVHPEQPVEVVNLTMTGINSHSLRLFVKEALRLDPDQIILYAGHNEYIGPFGPAGVLRPHHRSLPFIRLLQTVRSTRMGQALLRLRRATFPPSSPAETWQGLGGFDGARLDPADPRLETTRRHFARNLRNLFGHAARAGVPVLVALPAVNLTDWPPLASVPPVLDDAEALAAWQGGETNRLRSAWQVYRLARQLARAGDWEAAWPLYRTACDLDLHRFRADSAVRGMLRREARAAGVPLVDTDAFLHEENPGFETDADYFLEHVHLTFEGRVQVVGALIRALEEAWGAPSRTGVGRRLNPVGLAERLLFTDQIAVEMWATIAGFYETPLFREQPEAEQRMQTLAGVLARGRATAADPRRREVLARHVERLRAAYPDDAWIDILWGKHLVEFGAPQEAMRVLESGLERLPVHMDAWLNLLNLRTQAKDWQGAEEALRAAQRWAPDSPDLPPLAGMLYARQQRFAQALPYFEDAVRRTPSELQARTRLAQCFHALGRTQDAFRTLRESVRLHPGDPRSASTLAWYLLESAPAAPAEIEEALRLARRAVEIAPDAHRFRGTLALAYAADGQAERAREEAAAALDQARQQGDEEAVRLLIRSLRPYGLEISPQVDPFPRTP